MANRFSLIKIISFQSEAKMCCERLPICGFYENGQFKKGYSKTRLYGIWGGIKTRCCNPNDKVYSNYGGKGISMSEEWKNNFISFGTWALENGYTDSLTIDRIDPTQGYTPENCRWVDQQTQQNNRTNNHRLEYNGESHTIMEWTRITGLKDTTIHRRLEHGWPIEKVLTHPVMTPREAGAIGLYNRYHKKED